MPVWMPGAGGREGRGWEGRRGEETEGQVRQGLGDLVRITALILNGVGATGKRTQPTVHWQRAPPFFQVRTHSSEQGVKPRRVEAQ